MAKNNKFVSTTQMNPLKVMSICNQIIWQWEVKGKTRKKLIPGRYTYDPFQKGLNQIHIRAKCIVLREVGALHINYKRTDEQLIEIFKFVENKTDINHGLIVVPVS